MAGLLACAAHSWFGVSMPNSGYGIENPDNVYRHAGIDGSMSYTIAGRFGADPPMDFSLVLYGEVPGTGALTAEGAPTPRRRGIGFSASGHFQLGDDEAMVVTVDSKRARHLGFQFADPWGVAIGYVDRSGSLNNAQPEPNPDGTFTYVISAEDPGVPNWLDTGGLDAGLFAIRWQQVPLTEPADDAVRSAHVAPALAQVASGSRVNPYGSSRR